MRTFLHLSLLAVLASLVAAPAAAVGEPSRCVTISQDAACEDVAVSVFGSASGGFAAVSGTGDATTYMDRCLEWVCPSVAVALWGDAHAGCHASSVCVALAGKGHATHEGYGASVGGCDVLYHVCYPVAPALLP